MKEINVYGSGCKNCEVTAQRFVTVAKELGIDVQVNKVTDLEAIMNAGVVSTPAVGVDGVLKHSGSIPSVELVNKLLC